MSRIGHSLLDNARVTNVSGNTAAGTSVVNGSSVDMAGYEGVAFITLLGSAASDNTIKVQQSSDDGSSDAFADLENTEVSSDGTSTELKVEVYQPREQFVRPVVTRGTSTAVHGIWAVLFNPREAPIDNAQNSDEEAETHLSPAEGTA